MEFSVLYHASCPDGFCSAWLAWLTYGENASYHAMNYGDKPPENLAPNVLIVDYSFKRNVLLELAAKYNVVVLDHHKTAEEDLKGLDFCTFAEGKSGAGLTYEYFKYGEATSMHWLPAYVQDRDLWKWELPYSKEVNAYIATLPFEFEVWYEAAQLEAAPVVEGGRAILHFEDSIIQSAIKSSMRVVEFCGHTVPIVNATAFLRSELGHAIVDKTTYPFGLVYTEMADGKFKYSIRVSDQSDFDASELAKQFGGGGHKKAASFTSDKLLHRGG